MQTFTTAAVFFAAIFGLALILPDFKKEEAKINLYEVT
jgi:hypothetical protein